MEAVMTPAAMGVVLTGATTRAVDTTAGGLVVEGCWWSRVGR